MALTESSTPARAHHFELESPQPTTMEQFQILPHPPASPRTIGATTKAIPISSQALRLQSSRQRPKGLVAPSANSGPHSAPITRQARGDATGRPPAIKRSGGPSKSATKTGFSKTRNPPGLSAPPPKPLPKRPATVVTTNPTVWLDSRTSTAAKRPQTSNSYAYSNQRYNPTSASQISALTLSELDVQAFNEGAEILSVNFSNDTPNNHTERFRCDNTEVILRRGNTLNMTITTSFPINYNCLVTLSFIPVFRPQDRFAHFKTEKNVRTMKKGMSLGIPIPPNFSVGKYHVHLSMTKSIGKDIITHFHQKAIVVLFNCWEPMDDAYVEEEALREAYMLEDMGTIWRGVDSHKIPLLWEYGQYEEHCLEVALYLLRELNSDECKSATLVCRGLMAQINSRDQEGLLVESAGGRGSGSHVGGMHPARWTGSTAILAKYYRSRNAVRYGQCWVFAGVGVTLLRALGIVARPVTCYNAAHYCRKLGQVERFFSPTGDLLNSLNKDQLWVYHVWIEAWMRRDDLPEGYGGWQVLDPTSQGRQGGRFRVGPASVRAIKEGLSGKKWPYNNEYIRSEVESDVKYLRSLSHYNYGTTNKLMNLARVNRNEVGTSIVTQSPKRMEDEPLDITSSYKTMKTSSSSIPDKAHIFPSPAHDCSFEVKHNEGVKLGENLDLNIVVGNQGAMLRTIDGKVAGFAILYTGEPMASFMSMEFSGIISPGQSASVTIPLEAKRYLRSIQEQCILQFFVAIKARENKQLFLKVHSVQLQAPKLKLTCVSSLSLGNTLKVKLSFTNTLLTTMSRLLFILQAQSLCPSRELSYKKLVLPGESAVVECTLYPSEPGQFELLASLSCDQLTDIRGRAHVTVYP